MPPLWARILVLVFVLLVLSAPLWDNLAVVWRVRRRRRQIEREFAERESAQRRFRALNQFGIDRRKGERRKR